MARAHGGHAKKQVQDEEQVQEVVMDLGGPSPRTDCGLLSWMQRTRGPSEGQ